MYIEKHKKYIDTRISTIHDKLISVKDISDTVISDIISALTGKLSHNTLLGETYYCLNEPINDLKRLIEEWDILLHGDILGYIYQELQSKQHKNRKGQYFTPQDVVTYLAEKSFQCLKNIELKILDPACGSGQFLISLFRILLKNYTDSGDSQDIAKSKALKNLYGFDIDSTAVEIAKYNLSKIADCELEEVNIYKFDFLFKDDLNFENGHINSMKFGLIIGNPPWRSKFSPDEKRYYQKTYCSIKSGINTFTLFIERSFDFIQHEGIISYLIPEAYLNIKAHKESRKFVLHNSRISDISLWGEKFKNVFAPSASIILQKENSDSIRQKNIINIMPEKKEDKGTSVLIPQASYYKTPENIFNIKYSRKAVNIISTIENHDCMYLKDKARFFLGIVTGNNSLFISDKKSKEFQDPIIVGKDISQYRIKFSNHYFTYSPDKLQQVAPQHLYKSKNKILYKFIGKKLTFALDRDGIYTLNNVNGFIPADNSLNIETTLSLLNSWALQYFYEKNFFTVKVLRGNLERLPLKKISNSTQKKIKRLTEDIINSDIENTRDRENIEDIIFHEYGIKDHDAYVISSHSE